MYILTISGHIIQILSRDVTITGLGQCTAFFQHFIRTIFQKLGHKWGDRMSSMKQRTAQDTQ